MGKCPKCATEKPEVKEPEEPIVVGGQDLAKHKDFTALVVLEIKDKKGRIKGLKQWPHTDYRDVMADTRELYNRNKMRVLGVDQTAMGEPIIEAYQSWSMKVQGVKFTLVTKAEMVEYLRSLMDRGQLEIPKSGGPTLMELKAQIKEQEMLIGPSENPHFAHPQGRHDDLFWALAIACYVGRQWFNDNPYWVIRIS